MAELSKHPAVTCASNVEWETTIRGSRVYQIKYTHLDSRRRDEQGAQYGWMCSCPAFIFGRGIDGRGWCKHIHQVNRRRDRCGWNAELEPFVEPRKTKHGQECPDCGGPVEVFEVGV